MARTSRLWIAVCLSPALTGVVMPAEKRSAAEFIKEELDRGAGLEREGKLDEAAISFRRVIFLETRNGKARTALKGINARLAARLLDAAKAAWGRDPEAAARLLGRAHALDPAGKAVAAALKERGYVVRNGIPVREDAAGGTGKAEAGTIERRRKELALGPSFQVIRQGVFRFFTDVEGGDLKLRQMTAMIAEHHRVYREFLAAFDLDHPSDGLDVVLFRRREDYQGRFGDKSAGVYVPAKGAGFFFLTGMGDDFGTLIHEMTHQLDDKVLHAGRLPRCFEEGLAEYFAAGAGKGGAAKIELGRASPDRLQRFRELIRAGRTIWIPLKRFLSYPPDRFPDRFYAQSWALTHYLFTGPFPGKLIAYDVLLESMRPGDGEDLGIEDFNRILASYGLTPEEFESAFIDRFRKGES
jgi:hypothetical protein